MPYGKRTVLVVDDDAAIRRLEATILEREGYTVSEAGDGAAALEKLRRGGLDLLLLDLRMPMTDGWAVMESIAAMRKPPRVVIVTGSTDAPPDHLRPFVDAMISKPFQPADLVRACNKLKPAP
jgi:two-component system, OmpR family, response regulator ResD